MRLNRDLGIGQRCHSQRGDCVKGLERQLDTTHTMGALGAAIGYCQGLVGRRGTPQQHTEHVVETLKAIDAPWYRSHELLWSYRGNESVEQYINEAIAPLRAGGRVPIIITELDPGKDYGAVREIFETKTAVFPGETVLVRMSLGSPDSVESAAMLMQESLTEARREKRMPYWWPLLQSECSPSLWSRLKAASGDAWKYANVATTPFMSSSALEEVCDNITVAQFLVGLSEEMSNDGEIVVRRSGCMGPSGDARAYNLFEYATTVQPYRPLAIICGQSSPDWLLEDIVKRLTTYTRLFRDASSMLWSHVDGRIREELLKLPA